MTVPSLTSNNEASWTFEELVDPRHTAVLVVDMQNDFCSDNGSLGKRGSSRSLVQEMAPRLCGFLTEARKTPVSLFHTQSVQSEATISPVLRRKLKDGLDNTCIIGTWGADWFEEHEDFTPRKGEYVIQKHRYSAFIGTDLEMILRGRGIKTLIMTGTGTNACVESTSRDGFMLDFHIVILSDCTAASLKEAHEATLNNADALFGTVASSQQVIKAWGYH